MPRIAKNFVGILRRRARVTPRGGGNLVPCRFTYDILIKRRKYTTVDPFDKSTAVPTFFWRENYLELVLEGSSYTQGFLSAIVPEHFANWLSAPPIALTASSRSMVSPPPPRRLRLRFTAAALRPPLFRGCHETSLPLPFCGNIPGVPLPACLWPLARRRLLGFGLLYRTGERCFLS